MKEQDKIEEIFQENFKDFEVQPDASVWSGIESNISSGASGISGLSNVSVAGKVVIGLAVASGIALSAYFIGQSNEAEVDKTEETKIENITPTKSNEAKGSPLFADSAVVFEKASEELMIAEEEKVEENKIVEDVKQVQPAEELIVEVEKYSDTLAIQQSSITESPKAEKTSDKNLVQTTEVTESSNGTISETSKPMPPTGNNNEISQENTEQQTSGGSVNNTAQSSAAASMSPVANEEEVKEIHHVIPNIFTPNQDGRNDVFRIETEDATNMEVTILDKKGKIIFEWTGLYGFWDGNLPNGEAAKVDSYFYRVLLIKDNLRMPKTGWVRLER